MADIETLPSNTPKESGNTVARAGGIMMVSLTLSRLLGMLRDTVLASKFGLQLDADSFKVASTIPDMIFMLIAGGGLSSAFIPVFSEYLYTDREEDAWKVFSVVVTLCSLIATGLIVIAWVFAPQIAQFMSEGHQKYMPDGTLYADHVAHLGRIMLPAQFAFLVGSVLLGTLYARKQFTAPGLAPNVYNVGIILGALVGSSAGIGISGMAWGALIGAVLGNLVLPTLFMTGKGGWFRPSLDLNSPGVRKFFALLLPVILGFSLPSVCQLITQKFGSYYSTGVNTVLNSANNLMMAPLGIFGHSLALAAFPVLAQFYAHQKMDLYRAEVSKTLRTTLYLSIPASAVLLALAPQVVNLVYGYGKAAHEMQLGSLTVCLQVYSLGIWAWCMQPVLMRGFFSIHQTARPVIIGTIMTAVFIGLCVAVVHSSVGYLGLPAVTNVAAILLVISLLFALEKQVGSLDKKGIILTMLKSAAASVVMGGLGYGLFLFVPHALPKLVLVGVFLGVFCIIGWVYFFLTRAMKMPESSYLDRAFSRVGGKLKR